MRAIWRAKWNKNRRKCDGFRSICHQSSCHTSETAFYRCIYSSFRGSGKELTMEKVKWEKWYQFTSLNWYDGLIEFLFRFVAKTSEPLLAAGLVISAADYLSHGAVMTGNPAFALGWAWAQALALESSSGVVFVYSLQAFRQTDKVKGSIYLTLALMLAVVGGGMLLLQVNATTMGSAESAVPALNVLRVIVSIAYIFLLRAKSIRFSDLQDTSAQPAPASAVNPEVLNVLVEKLETLSITVNQLTNPSIPALPEQAEFLPDAPIVTWHEDGKVDTVQFPGKEPVHVHERNKAPANLEPIYQGKFTSKEQEIAAVLARMPGASAEDIAQEAGCSVRTAEKWIQRLVTP